MKRLKALEWNADADKLNKIIKITRMHQYDDTESVGFINDSYGEGKFLIGRLIQKKEVINTIVNHLGEKSEVKYTDYAMINFEMDTSSVGCWIVNPPRTIKPLLNIISSNLDDKIWFKEPTLNLIESFNEFQSIFQDIELSLIQAVNFELRANANALIEISGKGDLLRDLERLTHQNTHTINKLEAVLTYNRTPIKISITRGGGVVIHNRLTFEHDAQTHFYELLKIAIQNSQVKEPE